MWQFDRIPRSRGHSGFWKPFLGFLFFCSLRGWAQSEPRETTTTTTAVITIQSSVFKTLSGGVCHGGLLQLPLCQNLAWEQLGPLTEEPSESEAVATETQTSTFNSQEPTTASTSRTRIRTTPAPTTTSTSLEPTVTPDVQPGVPFLLRSTGDDGTDLYFQFFDDGNVLLTDQTPNSPDLQLAYFVIDPITGRMEDVYNSSHIVFLAPDILFDEEPAGHRVKRNLELNERQLIKDVIYRLLHDDASNVATGAITGSFGIFSSTLQAVSSSTTVVAGIRPSGIAVLVAGRPPTRKTQTANNILLMTSGSPLPSGVSTFLATIEVVTSVPPRTTITADPYASIILYELVGFCSEFLHYTNPAQSVVQATLTETTTIAEVETQFHISVETDVTVIGETFTASEPDTLYTAMPIPNMTPTTMPRRLQVRQSQAPVIPSQLSEFPMASISSACSLAATSPRSPAPTTSIITTATDSKTVSTTENITIRSTTKSRDLNPTTTTSTVLSEYTGVGWIAVYSFEEPDDRDTGILKVDPENKVGVTADPNLDIIAEKWMALEYDPMRTAYRLQYKLTTAREVDPFYLVLPTGTERTFINARLIWRRKSAIEEADSGVDYVMFTKPVLNTEIGRYIFGLDAKNADGRDTPGVCFPSVADGEYAAYIVIGRGSVVGLDAGGGGCGDFEADPGAWLQFVDQRFFDDGTYPRDKVDRAWEDLLEYRIGGGDVLVYE